MLVSLASTWAVLAASAAAKTCTNMTFTLPLSARQGVFNNVATPQTNLDATMFQLASVRQGNNGTAMALSGYATVSGTYNISAKYCTGAFAAATGANTTATSARTLQILTHGIGFDKSYWDLPYHNYNYSYIDTILSQGYDTLSYDRLGIGNSSHGDPKNEIQAPLEIAALAAITRMARAGTLTGVKKAEKIVHVGHSFGSAQTYAMAAMYPTISDGIVLTGFSMNASFVSLFGAGANFQQANLNQPLRFGNASVAAALNYVTQVYGLTSYLAPIDLTTIYSYNYPNGYLASSNVNANEFLFLYPPYFDTQIAYFAEETKQPVTIGELLTLSSLPMVNNFAGPVLVFTGEYDLPYCGGNCTATGAQTLGSIPAAVSKNFPKASTFQAYLQPNTGHGLTFHYNATAGYNYIASWLKSHNLS